MLVWLNRLMVFLAFFIGEGVAAADTVNVHPCLNVVGYTDYTTASIDLIGSKYASAEVVWSGFTGTLNGSFKVQVSDNSGGNWDDKTGATTPMTTTAGAKVISITNVTEQFYRLVFAHGGITGGTVNCYLIAKP